MIEDSCEAHGARFEGKAVGTFGAMGTFSFYFSHHISTIEGGMVVTDDSAVAGRESSDKEEFGGFNPRRREFTGRDASASGRPDQQSPPTRDQAAGNEK